MRKRRRCTHFSASPTVTLHACIMGIIGETRNCRLLEHANRHTLSRPLRHDDSASRQPNNASKNTTHVVNRVQELRISYSTNQADYLAPCWKGPLSQSPPVVRCSRSQEVRNMPTGSTSSNIAIKNTSPLAGNFHRQLLPCANERECFALQRVLRVQPPAMRETFFTIDLQKCLHSHTLLGFTFPSRTPISFPGNASQFPGTDPGNVVELARRNGLDLPPSP